MTNEQIYECTLRKQKEDIIEMLIKCNNEKNELDKIIDMWEKVYKPRKEIKGLNDGTELELCEPVDIVYIDNEHIYHRERKWLWQTQINT